MPRDLKDYMSEMMYFAESAVSLRKAIELYTEMGRLGMAARHIKVTHQLQQSRPSCCMASGCTAAHAGSGVGATSDYPSWIGYSMVQPLSTCQDLQLVLKLRHCHQQCIWLPSWLDWED
jgi:hypothetical protein